MEAVLPESVTLRPSTLAKTHENSKFQPAIHVIFTQCQPTTIMSGNGLCWVNPTLSSHDENHHYPIMNHYYYSP